MVEVDTNNLIGTGSNSKVFCCYLDGVSYAAKVPHTPDRFMSCFLQVESLLRCQKSKTSFVTPNVVMYDQKNNKWGELLVMDKLENIFPVSFLIRNGMVDREFIISSAAKAIAELHDLGISGFDVEFYWSYAHKKLALLDLGPSHTIGCSSREMIRKHYEYAVSKKNWMTLWNIISELLKSEQSIDIFDQIMKGVNLPPLEKLQDAVDERAEQDHIRGVAKNHFLQLIGDCSQCMQGKAVSLFIRKYFSSTSAPSYAYASAFEDAYKQQITSSTAYLYISKYHTISKMSNSVSIL